MHTTATLHVHPTCIHKRDLIEQLQFTTGCSVILRDGKPLLVPQRHRPAASDRSHGGRAA